MSAMNLIFLSDLVIYMGHPVVIGSVLLMGYHFYQKTTFFNIISLLLFTLSYNLWLKNIWQYPLPYPLEGFGLPSGHMHGVCIVWGSLALLFRYRGIRAILVMALISYGFSLVYKGFHFPIDVFAAAGVAMVSLLVQQWFLKHIKREDKEVLFSILLCLLAFSFMFSFPANIYHATMFTFVAGFFPAWIMGYFLAKKAHYLNQWRLNWAGMGYVFVLSFSLFILGKVYGAFIVKNPTIPLLLFSAFCGVWLSFGVPLMTRTIRIYLWR